MTAEKTKVKFKLNTLLNPVQLGESLETLEIVLPEINKTRHHNKREDLAEILDNTLEREELLSKFELLAMLLDKPQSIEEVGNLVDELYQAEKDRYEENMQSVFAQTKPFEKTARSLHLLYVNATGDTNVYIMGVNKARFADSANPKHFEKLQDYLRKQFYLFQMEDSPFYISYVGDIGSKTAMDKLAMIAQETRALAIVDIKPLSNAKEVVEYAKKLKIKGISAHLAHLVTMGTWVYAHNAFDVEFIRDEQGRLRRVETQMAVPAAGAFVGKMMSVPPGYYITGLEQSAILGINGVKVSYNYERIDSKEWSDCGVIQIISSGHIMGAATANISNNYDLRKFPKVDIANALLKDLVQFCNNKAFSKWGKNQQRESKREIEIYLNRRIKHELIEGYSVDKIAYDEHEESVDIEISVKFYEIADKFNINLQGKRNGEEKFKLKNEG